MEGLRPFAETCMIGISKLYCGSTEASDRLRYHHGAKSPAGRKPIAVWNCTRACNLSCSHCYSGSDTEKGARELSTSEGRKLIDQLADFGCPVVLFSGGEPLLRKDVPELAAYAVFKGLHAVVSSNGTLIDDAMATRLKRADITYVGISLDGLEATHDRLRKRQGAFKEAMRGVKACIAAGLKVGLRCTINKDNLDEIPAIFNLLETEHIPRACFYHLVSAGRGKGMQEAMPSREETRRAVDAIIDGAARLHSLGQPTEILTVDNLSDGPHLYLRMLREGHPSAEKALELLKLASGGGSGVGISCVGWDGEVYPDQFWRDKPLGNVLERPFGEIWSDLSNPLMSMLKEKAKHVKGRCARCRFLDICGGNFRARAEALTGDPWASDPACLLSDEEAEIK